MVNALHEGEGFLALGAELCVADDPFWLILVGIVHISFRRSLARSLATILTLAYAPFSLLLVYTSV